jgi:26S proteasome regulatory subunit N1
VDTFQVEKKEDDKKKEDKKADKDNKEKDKPKEEKKEEPLYDLSMQQSVAVLGIALIAMGEEIGSEMCMRAFGHLVRLKYLLFQLGTSAL